MTISLHDSLKTQETKWHLKSDLSHYYYYHHHHHHYYYCHYYYHFIIIIFLFYFIFNRLDDGWHKNNIGRYWLCLVPICDDGAGSCKQCIWRYCRVPIVATPRPKVTIPNSKGCNSESNEGRGYYGNFMVMSIISLTNLHRQTLQCPF